MAEEEQRTSAMKSKHLEPLMGSPVQQPPQKQTRVQEELAQSSDSVHSRVPGSPYPPAPLDDEPPGAHPPGLPAGGQQAGAGLVPGVIPPLPGAGQAVDPMVLVNDMFNKVLSNMTEVKSSVNEVKASVAEVQADLSQVRSSMVNREEFNTFKADVDSRFVAMSEVSGNSVEVQGLKSAIQRQARVLDRLDVAHKSICFSNFPLDMSVSARLAEIEKFMLLHFPSVPLIKIESVFSGKAGAQHITKNTILEVPSQHLRNKLLTDIAEKALQFTCLTHTIGIGKAKTQQQRDRNTAVLKAFDKIKVHESATGKSVTIEFKIKDSWDRTVSVDKQVVFLQRPGESLGTFFGTFASLSM